MLTRTMPTPPASWTARLLFTRAVTPRSQTTILPATLAGSRTGETVVLRGEAQANGLWIGTGQSGGHGVDEWGRLRPGWPRRHRSSSRHCRA